MRIYFSGGRGKLAPEYLIQNRKPHVMVTFMEVVNEANTSGTAKDRLRQHIYRHQGKDLSTKLHTDKARSLDKRPVPKVRTGKAEKAGLVY